MQAGTATDADLLRLLQQGHGAALDELVERYQSPLYTLIAFFSDSLEGGERTFGEVFVRMVRQAEDTDVHQRADLSFYRIAFDCLDELTEAVTSQRPLSLKQISVHSSEGDPEQLLEASLEEAVRRLPVEYRKVLVLRDMLSISIEDVGEVLFLSSTDVRNRLSRARKMIRRSLRRSGALLDGENRELHLVTEGEPRVGA